MAFGSVNVPTTPDAALEQLKADIVSGEISVPLCDDTGTELCTEEGEVLFACRKLDISTIFS